MRTDKQIRDLEEEKVSNKCKFNEISIECVGVLVFDCFIGVWVMPINNLL